MYTIKLVDGTKIENLQLNGNNFISNEPIDASVFEGNCSSVEISDGENISSHQAMELIHLTNRGGEYWFALRGLSNSELEAIKTRSDLEYIALMCDIEL